ncbi:hypothetical protein [Nesterenkonia flava]|uniref:DNA modification methylase n=1 Tax=Nesterenkonia flava TaxID=469799 RepID=A0ABU1FWM0_9MICC|nr:hypothetical protein [Nesterenkonia flava]MDR5713079.1 hypothetical protein [Nesterenkonia flava]
MKFAPRRAAAATLVAAGLLATGCSAINYQATTHQYSASDGVRFETGEGMGDVKFRHIAFVAAEEGAPARLIGSISNGVPHNLQGIDSTAEDAEIEISVEGETFSLTLEPGESVSLEHDEEFVVPAIGAAPGTMQELEITVNGEQLTKERDGGEEIPLAAPVLDGGLAEYRALVPDADDETLDSMTEHLEHGPDTWGGGAAHYDPESGGH